MWSTEDRSGGKSKLPNCRLHDTQKTNQGKSQIRSITLSYLLKSMKPGESCKDYHMPLRMTTRFSSRLQSLNDTTRTSSFN